jgi:hypothetical protein
LASCRPLPKTQFDCFLLLDYLHGWKGDKWRKREKDTKAKTRRATKPAAVAAVKTNKVLKVTTKRQ